MYLLSFKCRNSLIHADIYVHTLYLQAEYFFMFLEGISFSFTSNSSNRRVTDKSSVFSNLHTFYRTLNNIFSNRTLLARLQIKGILSWKGSRWILLVSFWLFLKYKQHTCQQICYTECQREPFIKIPTPAKREMRWRDLSAHFLSWPYLHWSHSLSTAA